MRNLYFLISVFLTISLSGQKTFLSENFDYIEGSQIRAHGWTAHSGGDVSPILVNGEGLTMATTLYAGNRIGRAALVINNGADENKPFNAWVTQPLDGESPKNTYASFLIKPNGEIPAATGTTRPYFFHFGTYSDEVNPAFSSLSTAFRARTFIYPGTTPGNFRMNLSFNENEPLADNITGNYISNNTHLVVVKYTSIAGADNDEVSLFIFKNGDDISKEPSKPTIGPLKTTSTGTDQVLQAVVLRQYQANQNVIVDGIIVKDHWNLTSLVSSLSKLEMNANLQVFPNPTDGSFVNITSDILGIKEVTISDLTGRILSVNPIQNGKVDISSLAKGMYLLQVSKGSNIQTQKLVVR